jgi:hypothetical protein
MGNQSIDESGDEATEVAIAVLEANIKRMVWQNLWVDMPDHLFIKIDIKIIDLIDRFLADNASLSPARSELILNGYRLKEELLHSFEQINQDNSGLRREWGFCVGD